MSPEITRAGRTMPLAALAVAAAVLAAGCAGGPDGAATGAASAPTALAVVATPGDVGASGPASAAGTAATEAVVPTAADAGDGPAPAPAPTNVAPDVVMVDRMTMVGPESFLDGYAPRNPDGTVNAVVEIPAGTTAKWEVTDDDGNLHWDVEDGQPRMVQYLGYPLNYGMVPRTKLAESMGGDGDPLDILVLGDALPRGTVVPVRVVAVVRYTDDGERDDKLVAVRPGTPFADVDGLPELEASFGGVVAIVDTWFLNYKGPGVFEALGWQDAGEAMTLLDAAAAAYAEGAP